MESYLLFSPDINLAPSGGDAGELHEGGEWKLKHQIHE